MTATLFLSSPLILAARCVRYMRLGRCCRLLNCIPNPRFGSMYHTDLVSTPLCPTNCGHCNNNLSIPLVLDGVWCSP
ncbi:hypothetical protein PF005_g4031 [Phytophthora fragariae]|uniref:ShKT domain-containing protein n=1 Tax=Phytophthora fragariae TaxID=53985 RepID=A0A6A3MER5_9STRA|nr:hypothetical protein PF003_g3974 [Phytophthora fragariae]KAE8945873.1 hypothetical protein PF009_g4484 [Phytophthora fragariae]KAE9030919.1 hypothetical protein PF011_g360 [Phytophthora fragariae]KAE9131150.1 hypothetical protein PF010_g3595 [Phytophthora fragariae]KAE9131379.1 hypothetical protein PF007_g4164 [Phytophthora fragariae]